MSDCIFCKILDGDIPSNRVYEDEHCIAFHDVQPAALCICWSFLANTSAPWMH